MKRIIILSICAAALVAGSTKASAQQITEKDTTYVTYPFDDPDPVVANAKLYPYFRYDGYSQTSVPKEWKMVILENDLLRIRILPEIGGKVWSVVDKKSGREMFYDNKVIKFRDISLRGPWTSGGIEFNFGVIGHAPTCASAVDYKTVRKEDGVSCYISSFELLTRTHWTIEIFLPKDAGFFRTTTTWSNTSVLFQPYYTWMNTAETATEDLEIIYPATYTIGHEGQISGFPYDGEEKRDVSRYSQLDFGADKSFHPSGSQRGYFGAYWNDSDFGIMHCASRDEKLGRKFFSWAKSEQGGIWQELLSDHQSQYVELQSGRLFNQNQLESVETPYKEILFTPYGTDIFTEYWYPFSGIGKADDFSAMGAACVQLSGSEAKLVFYPVTNVESGTLAILDEDGALLCSKAVSIRAAEIFEDTFKIEDGRKAVRITLCGREIWNASDKKIDRPNTMPEDYRKDAASSEMECALYYAGMRRYTLAEECVDKALEADGYYADALSLKAELLYRKCDWAGAYDCCNRALSINEYHAKANYMSGLAARQMGKTYDALDRFEIAALSAELRSAACTELCRMHIRLGDATLALEYAEKALRANGANMAAMALGHIAACLSGSPDADRWLDAVDSLDPLTHLPSFIGFVEGKVSKEMLASSIREEYAWQEYLEAALLYASLGLKEDAARLADAAEQNALTALWGAYFKGDASLIGKAEEKSVDFVCPFREESVAMLQWAVENGGGWKSAYLLARLYAHLGLGEKAVAVMAGTECDYAPFYAMRYDLTGSKNDIEKAVSLDPGQWRYLDRLAKHYMNEGDIAAAVAHLEPYCRKHRENFRIHDTYLQALVKFGKYAEAERILERITILPFEGQSGSHVMYRDVKLHLAASAIDSGKVSSALKKIDEARLWPQNLGVGKPYDYMIDSTLEDWMTAVAYARMGRMDKAEEYLGRIKAGDGSWRESFIKASSKGNRVSDMLGNLDSTLDQRLF